MAEENKNQIPAEEQPEKITTELIRLDIPDDQDSKRVVGEVVAQSKSAIKKLPLEALPPTRDPSWPLKQYFDGDINLDVELSQRFKNVPVLTATKYRAMGPRKQHGVATISAPDDSSWIVFDADKESNIVEVSFTLNGMLSLRFTLQGLNDIDRKQWVSLMRREEGGLAFLWGAQRWEHDYIICIKRKYFTNIFAFSPDKFEAAARLTPAATKTWVDWLEQFWNTESANKTDELPPILTW